MKVKRVEKKVRLGALALTLALLCVGCSGAKDVPGAPERSKAGVESAQDQSGENEPGKDGKDAVEGTMAPADSVEATGSSDSTATPAPTDSPEPTATPAPTPSEEEIYADVVSRSLTYAGNNFRLKKVIEKLRAGEKISVAILGGSITEGAGAGTNDKGYAFQFVQALGDTYAAKGMEQLNYVIPGLSGTPSVLGLMRYQQDVVKPLGEVPDLLIIEFAVNDWQEATNGRAYESMVYEALSAKEDCAVIALCSVAKTGWNAQDTYLPIVKHYQIPLVSLKDAVFVSGTKTRIAASQYFMDDYHPKFYGHQLMKDCLMNLLAQADAAEEDEAVAIPGNAVKGRDFAGLVQVDSKNQGKGLKVGSFGETDEKVVQMFFTKAAAFPNNFHHAAGAKNDPLKLTVSCSKILINYKTANDKNFGKAEIYVDGALVATADGYSSGGWNNCNVLLVLDEAQAAKHVLEVKMAQDDAEKAFTIFSISYAE